MKIALGLMVYLLVAGEAFAAPSSCPFADDSKEEKLCISAEADRAEKMMLAYLSAAKAALAGDDSLVQHLSDSQAAWLVYRKEQCDNEQLWARLRNKPFSFRLSMECQLHLTQGRTRDIWNVYLLRNSGTPILSEPHFQ